MPPLLLKALIMLTVLMLILTKDCIAKGACACTEECGDDKLSCCIFGGIPLMYRVLMGKMKKIKN